MSSNERNLSIFKPVDCCWSVFVVRPTSDFLPGDFLGGLVLAARLCFRSLSGRRDVRRWRSVRLQFPSLWPRCSDGTQSGSDSSISYDGLPANTQSVRLRRWLQTSEKHTTRTLTYHTGFRAATTSGFIHQLVNRQLFCTAEVNDYTLN